MNTETLIKVADDESKELPKTITVDSAIIRAAQLCQAGDDVRFYLNGIRLTNEGQVQATNGHIMFIADGGFSIEQSVTISIDRRLPRSGDACIKWLSDEHGFIAVSVPGGDRRNKHFYFTAIKGGKWPDLSRLIPDGPPVPNANVQVAAQYLKIAGKVFSAHSAVHITTFSDSTDKPVMFSPSRPASSFMGLESNPRLFVMQMGDPKP